MDLHYVDIALGIIAIHPNSLVIPIHNTRTSEGEGQKLLGIDKRYTLFALRSNVKRASTGKIERYYITGIPSFFTI
jgi:hypothetical protein